MKGTAVDDPDTLRNRLEDIKRRVGATLINLVCHPAILPVNGFEAATNLEQRPVTNDASAARNT
jgi:hypothetical protein